VRCYRMASSGGGQLTLRDAALVTSGVVGGALVSYLLQRRDKRLHSHEVARKSIHVVGDVYLDMIAKVSSLPKWDGDTLIEMPIETHPGGSALNTAIQLASLIETRNRDDLTMMRMRFDKCVLHSLVGDDVYGRLVTERVRQTPVVLSAPSVGGQGVCICLSGSDDRAFVSYRGTVERLCERDLDKSILISEKTGHVHFAAYYDCTGLQEAMPALMQEARAKGATISLVPQSDQSGEWKTDLQDLLYLVDVLIASEEEVLMMTHVEGSDLDAAIAVLLEKRCKLVVVTRGKMGAIAVSLTDRWEQPTKARQVVDTTGAGDAFAAGFLYGWCQAGDVSNGLIYGCACGAAAVGQMGGSHPLPPEEISKCMLGITPAHVLTPHHAGRIHHLHTSQSMPTAPSDTSSARRRL